MGSMEAARRAGTMRADATQGSTTVLCLEFLRSAKGQLGVAREWTGLTAPYG